MCGGPDIPQPPDPAIAAQQARDAQAARDAEQRRRASEARTTATASARADAEAEAQRRGLQYSDFSSTIDREIARILGTIPPDLETPGSYFTNFGKNTFADEEVARRNRYVGDINRVSPYGFENTALPDTVIDPFIQEIISSQFGEAQRGIDAARSRGALVDSGYAAAGRALENKRAGSRAAFDPIATSVLGASRGTIRNEADTARARAGNLSLGDQFDLGGYNQRIQDVIGREREQLGGRIKNLAPTSLFDLGEIVNAGGAAQGGQNPVIASASRTQQKQKRGLGTQGAF